MGKKWSHKVHRMLLLWLSQIGNICKIHHDESVRLSGLSDRLTIIIIILTSGASITSFINISDYGTRAKMIINIIIGCISLLAAIMAAISNSMKYGENSQKHQGVAAVYSDLSNLIQSTAASSNKPDPGEFMQIITDRINIIQRFGPPLIDKSVSISDLPNYILVRNAIKEKGVETIIDEKDINIFMSESSDSAEKKDMELTEIIIDENK